jgi:hypothetical protein
MTNNLEQHFAAHEELAYQSVMAETFGHLAPKPHRAYPGFIIFCLTEYNEEVTIQANFEGLDDSPWFHDDLRDYLARKCRRPGEILRFDGVYYKYRSGGFRFTGQITQLIPAYKQKTRRRK